MGGSRSIDSDRYFDARPHAPLTAPILSVLDEIPHKLRLSFDTLEF